MVGGMPEAVSRFAETKNINDVMEIHRNISALYKLDFTQYEAEDRRLLLTNAYELISSELLKQNRRYIISDLRKGLHFDRIEGTFLWLIKSGVSLPVFNITEPRIPLRINEKHSLFKLYFADVGMLTSEYGMQTKSKLLNGDSKLNAGGIYENAIAQMFTSLGRKLFFYTQYNAQKHRNDIEIDFLLSNESKTNFKICPVEVKSSKNYTATSLGAFKEKYGKKVEKSYIIHPKNFSAEDGVVKIPPYMVFCVLEAL